jgi:hypothetical protein
MRTHLTHAAPALAPFLRFKNERVKTSVNDEGKRGIPRFWRIRNGFDMVYLY